MIQPTGKAKEGATKSHHPPCTSKRAPSNFYPLGPVLSALVPRPFTCKQLEAGSWKLTADSGQLEIFRDFKGRTAGIGPTLGYILPVGENTLVAEFRWLPELETKNRLKGDYYWLKIVYQF